MLETILFALLWFVLGVIATIVGFCAFIAWADRMGVYNDRSAKEAKEDAETVLKFVRTLFPKK